MQRIKCPKCEKTETIQKAGFVRSTQRFFCKECRYHFTPSVTQKRNSALKKRTYTTITDISRITGSSVSTVSRALRDHSDISSRTRQNIQKVASELDYYPNPIAKSLHSRETHTIGIIVPDIANPFFASVLSGTQHAASAAGYNLMICQSDESHLTEVSNVQTLMANRVDGLLICHSKETQSFDHVRLQLKKGIPVIHFDRVSEELETPKVVLDDVHGSFKVTDHLIQKGCKQIAFIGGPKRLFITKRRLEGYRQALKKADLPIDAKFEIYTDFTPSTVEEGLQKILKQKPKTDSIFCISDSVAIHVMLFLKKKKISIPQQIRVAGFGNDYTSRIIEPGLTSFDPHPFEMGKVTMGLFIKQIISDKAPSPETITIEGELIIRASTL